MIVRSSHLDAMIERNILKSVILPKLDSSGTLSEGNEELVKELELYR